MIVDFRLVLQHQEQTILTMQRQRRFLRASSLFVEDLMGQRQDQTLRLSPRHKDRSQRHSPFIQKIQKFVEVPRVAQRLDRPRSRRP